MTQGQQEPAQLYCPRCGGLMRKPPGSNLYWHASNNHPRCDITNIHEKILEAKAGTTGPGKLPPDGQRAR